MAPAPLVCPQCGGTVRPEEEDAFAACGFCGSRLYLDPGAAVPHQILPATIPREELPGRLGRWLQDAEAVGRPTPLSTRLLFFPFWVIPERRQARLVPAASLLHQDVGRFHLPSGDLKTFREDLARDGEVRPASVLLSTAAGLEGSASGSPAPDGARLVHLPFWDVAFRIGAREHRVWIDAALGQVLPLTLPASASGRLDGIYAALLTATFLVVFAGFAAFFVGGPIGAFVGVILIAVGGPAGWWAARSAIRRAESA